MVVLMVFLSLLEKSSSAVLMVMDCIFPWAIFLLIGGLQLSPHILQLHMIIVSTSILYLYFLVDSSCDSKLALVELQTGSLLFAN